MKRILLFFALVITPITVLAQEHQIDYHINDEGEFIRNDSEKQYYVFYYDSTLTASQLNNLFYKKWKELLFLPKVFDTVGWDNSLFEDGVIRGVTDGKAMPGFLDSYLFGASLVFEYTFRLQFRDGRVRLDPPTITVLSTSDGHRYSSKMWIHSKGLIEKKEEALSRRKQCIDFICNSIINNLLTYVDFTEDWTVSQTYNPEIDKYFSLGDNFAFEFSDSTRQATYKFDNLDKDNLYDLLGICISELIKRKSYDYLSYDQSIFFEDGVKRIFYHGYQDIVLKSKGFIFNYEKYRIEYSGLYCCEDGLIKVYAPVITRAELITADKPVKFDTARFFLGHTVCNKDGTHKTDAEADENIAYLEHIFNNLVYDPLRMIHLFLKKANEPEEEW